MELSPLPYHSKVCEHFKQYPAIWDFFAGAVNKKQELAAFKTALLKNTYQFFPENNKPVFDAIGIAKQKLNLGELAVTVHQSQLTDELDIQAIYLENEATIVFSGPILKLLDHEELLAVIANGLAPIQLSALRNGELEIASQIVASIGNNLQNEMAYQQTATLFKLYTKIFCDRAAYLACGSINPVITSLVKTSTGLEKVSAADFLHQANEMFGTDPVNTPGILHPENFIRAKAIELWAKENTIAENAIIKIAEGQPGLDNLDIFEQQKLTWLTTQFLNILLRPKWMQGNSNLTLAKHYLDDFVLDGNAVSSDELREKIINLPPSIKEYLSYILYDFATADASLAQIPVGFCAKLSEDFSLRPTFENLLKKEFRLSQKKMEQLVKKAVDNWRQFAGG